MFNWFDLIILVWLNFFTELVDQAVLVVKAVLLIWYLKKRCHNWKQSKNFTIPPLANWLIPNWIWIKTKIGIRIFDDWCLCAIPMNQFIICLSLINVEEFVVKFFGHIFMSLKTNIWTTRIISLYIFLSKTTNKQLIYLTRFEDNFLW